MFLLLIHEFLNGKMWQKKLFPKWQPQMELFGEQSHIQMWKNDQRDPKMSRSDSQIGIKTNEFHRNHVRLTEIPKNWTCAFLKWLPYKEPRINLPACMRFANSKHIKVEKWVLYLIFCWHLPLISHETLSLHTLTITVALEWHLLLYYQLFSSHCVVSFFFVLS